MNSIIEILSKTPEQRTQQEAEILFENTKEIAFFRKLTEEQKDENIHKNCCQAMTLQMTPKDSSVISFGEQGDTFYIILRGKVGVWVPLKKPFRVSSLAVKFLTTQKTQSNTAVSLKGSEKDSKGRRLGQFVNTASVPQEHEKTVVPAKSKNILLKHRDQILEKARKNRKKSFEVEVEDFQEVTELHQGSGFGELSLISDKPRAATIVAKEDCYLAVLNKKDFRRILGRFEEKRNNLKVNFLYSLPFFKDWTRMAMQKFSYYFSEKALKKHQLLFREGEKTDGVFFVKSGEFKVLDN
mgnify:FL=1